MSKTIVIVGIFFILTAGHVTAQQDAQITQYMFNTVQFNPGAAGVDGVTRFTGLFHSQWTGYQPTSGGGGAPTTELLSFTTPLAKINSGVAAFIQNDHLGPINNLQGQVSFAYHLGFKDSKLSFGIAPSFFAQSLNFDQLRYIDKDDPFLQVGGTQTQIKPDLAAGAFYRKEKWYLGASFDHLLKPNFDFGVSKVAAPLQPHVYVTGGYFYEVNFDLRFQFSALVKSDLTKTTTDVSAIAYLKDTMWGGLSFRESEAVILLLGYSFGKDKQMRLGYSLDYVVNNQTAKQPTSHEFMLIYELPNNPGPAKKVVRTPRYRH